MHYTLVVNFMAKHCGVLVCYSISFFCFLIEYLILLFLTAQHSELYGVIINHGILVFIFQVGYCSKYTSSKVRQVKLEIQVFILFLNQYLEVLLLFSRGIYNIPLCAYLYLFIYFLKVYKVAICLLMLLKNLICLSFLTIS